VPTRKQRRRREKLQRHEYEYVVETDEGEEVVDRPIRGDEKQPPKVRGPVDRRGRPLEKPTWGRVLKRSAIFAPIVIIVVFVLAGKDASSTAKIANAVILMVFFVLFSYVVDVVMYRTLSKRQQRRD
jgi:hypothetical protein